MSYPTRDILTFLYHMGGRYTYANQPCDRYHTPAPTPVAEPAVPTTQPKLQAETRPPITTTPQLSTPIAMPKIISTHPDLAHPAYACDSLDALRQAIESFEGSPLKHTALNTVFSDGPRDAKLMLIGEAPGADEDAQGKPFVGMSGQLLNKMMAAIGLKREDIYISNIVPWRPPGNRTPSTQEIATFLPFIEQHIYLKKPQYILLLGGIAVKALFSHRHDLKGVGIMRLRGRWQHYTPRHKVNEGFSVPVLPTFHPAFLLRSPNQKVHAWEDLQKLKRVMDGLEDAQVEPPLS